MNYQTLDASAAIIASLNFSTTLAIHLHKKGVLTTSEFVAIANEAISMSKNDPKYHEIRVVLQRMLPTIQLG
ncbi:hypothetical protein M2281_000140 [Mesorhizobium soli]|jgi:hypothetical protein|uniref:hypothetical protein n=1 Tax=Pseudaminobacter soli (ex Li et al. 2025) TaxID=1295366 RepID=UPI002477083F|nr:hypothetical protein [Mesorhizobium soli]MDH6229568.1 hypothetical protein [Mesorhizobium soli]